MTLSVSKTEAWTRCAEHWGLEQAGPIELSIRAVCSVDETEPLQVRLVDVATGDVLALWTVEPEAAGDVQARAEGVPAYAAIQYRTRGTSWLIYPAAQRRPPVAAPSGPDPGTA